jgi:peptidoglycan/LPS O-acetylase OafA/YrhL
VAVSVVARALGFHWWILIARCDGFALGAILAVLFIDPERTRSLLGRYRRGFFAGVGSALAFLLATLPLSLWYDFEASMSFWPSLTVLGFNLFFFSLIGLVLCHTGDPALRVLRDRRLCYLGIISYGIYIYHPIMFLCVARLTGALGMGDAWWVGPAKMAASVFLASLSWRYLEQPILALRDRFRYSFGPSATFHVANPAAAVHGADA